MTTAGELLRNAVEKATPRLRAMSDANTSAKRGTRWSRKEELGHLVDSASNNHQRFVRAQFSDDLVFPGYEQEKWVEAQRYSDTSWESLVTLWREFNLHIAHVMESVPVEVATKSRAKHNLDQIAWTTVPSGETTTLDYFMRDYVGHLEHHMKSILAELP